MFSQAIGQLRPLREDLDIYKAPPARNGQSSWTLHDITTNRFFSLGRKELLILKHWNLGHPEDIVAAVNATGLATIAEADVEETAVFLAQAQLLQASSARDTEYLLLLAKLRKQSFLMMLLHHYLSFRIPLIRPARMLRTILPVLRWIFSPVFLALTLFAGLCGGAMVSVRWDEFTSFIPDMLTAPGIIGTGLAMILAKTLHEFGHALTATRFGCRVGTMGLAFIVGCPMLFTDATESWKLSCHRERFLISFAGIGTELMLACWSLLLWNMTAPGTLRDTFFLFSSVTWLISLVINVSPFMRFDGYYLLMDLWGIPNLQPRAFALAKWALRRLLFRLHDEPPESVPISQRRLMILYAVCTWLYRVSLFLGIAYLVYSYFFKVLGAILMSVEIGWFIVLPILREIGMWWKLRRKIGVRSMLATLFVIILLAVTMLIVPLPTNIQIPAILKLRDEVHIYAPGSGYIEDYAMHSGDAVTAGQILLRIHSPESDRAIVRSTLQIRMLEQRIATASAGSKLTSELSVLQESLRAARSALREKLADKERLVVVAPYDGRVVACDDTLRNGMPIRQGYDLLMIGGAGGWEVCGLVDSEHFARLTANMTGSFYPDTLQGTPVKCFFEKLDEYADRNLAWPIMADIYGGQMETVQERKNGGKRIAQTPHHIVQAGVATDCSRTTQLRGTLVVRTLDLPLWEKIYKLVRNIWERESDF